MQTASGRVAESSNRSKFPTAIIDQPSVSSLSTVTVMALFAGLLQALVTGL